jgi:hypothetical protein
MIKLSLDKPNGRTRSKRSTGKCEAQLLNAGRLVEAAVKHERAEVRGHVSSAGRTVSDLR